MNGRRPSKLADKGLAALNMLYGTSHARATCRIQSISIGHKNRFFGRAKLAAWPDSDLLIGDSNTFRSTSRSNLIGIDRPCIISTNTPEAVLTIGDRCGFSGTTIGCFLGIEIGNQVRFGANTLVTDSDWHLDDDRVGAPRPIRIGDRVWIGVGATVLKGVDIGQNTVVGAASVVTKSLPANVYAAGNPCKVIGPLGD